MERPLISYEKKNSYDEVYISHGETSPAAQTKRAQRILRSFSSPEAWRSVLNQVFDDLSGNTSVDTGFRLTPFVADEMRLIPDEKITKYLFHRYRYEKYPQQKRLDGFPPYVQIEPSSICNFRCVFCYQINTEFSRKGSEHMGSMPLHLYKEIVDQCEDQVEFLSLASRGEPLIAKSFDQMLEYSIGKFLNLKVNTNASLLSESRCHALLCGGAQTIVFSADAADSALYSRLRVNGNLSKVVKNIERFQKIRETQYSGSSVISRVSGVLVNESQSMKDMVTFWGGLVDQISFVKYNPWEDVYSSPMSGIQNPCSDLWRRMFFWHDGSVNPCDTDYKSLLSVGKFSGSSNISDIWLGPRYTALRAKHQQENRADVFPCNQCVVV